MPGSRNTNPRRWEKKADHRLATAQAREFIATLEARGDAEARAEAATRRSIPADMVPSAPVPGGTSRLTSSVGKSRSRGADAPLKVKLRGFRSGDLGLVIDSWCGSFHRSPVVGEIDPNLFKIEQRNRINRLLPRTKQIIACSEEDEDLVYGWVCFAPQKVSTGLPTIHYMCVKPEYQGQGVGRALLDLVRQACGKTHVDPVFFTHWTYVAKKLTRKWNVIYNPFLLEL